MGLDEFGREVRGMPSVTSSYGEPSSGVSDYPFRYDDDDEDEEFHRRKFSKTYGGNARDYAPSSQHRTKSHPVPRSLPRSSRSHSMDREDGPAAKYRGSGSGSAMASASYGTTTVKLTQQKRRGGHPSKAYAEQPLLCQFVWDKERQLDPKQSDIIDAHALAAEEVEKTNERDTSILHQEYVKYNQNYCLKYIRHFFNQHIDDMWFRQKYSPLEYKRWVQQERNRASLEAATFLTEVVTSVRDYDLLRQTQPQDNDDDANSRVATSPSTLSVPSFILQARLGGGVKPTSTSSYHESSIPSRKRKYSSSLDGTVGTPHHDPVKESGIPKSHLFSFLQNDSALYIMDVPSHVSDMHLYHALRHHTDNDSIHILSSSVAGGKVASAAEETGLLLKDLYKDETHSKKKGGHYLDRCAWAIFSSRHDREMVLESLLKSQRHSSDHSRNYHHHDDDRENNRPSHTVRLPKVLELDVDCSDPYGRTEIDSDGKGGELTTMKEGDTADQVPSGLPLRRASVFVSTSSAIQTQSVIVLSAALSSKSRYEDDCKSALLIAKRLDILRNIPAQSRLVNILSKLFKNDDSLRFQYDSDVLDVAIAYLRRVHLFSFYNGCVAADNAGSTLSGKHPTSVVHLRLKDADEILKKSKEDNSEKPVDTFTEGKPVKGEPKDMLVMRLDTSIAKAIDVLSVGENMEMASPFVVNESIDPLASEIESMEEKCKSRWLTDHSVVDEDQRARCSFHFCRKLFKDVTYLIKHLLKKHGEHLNAEMAKCHDQYMMAWWEEETTRPIPPVLVECGPKFGLIECTLESGKEPFVTDPEPELWRKEKEKEEKLAEKRSIRNHDEKERVHGASNVKNQMEINTHSSGFVDVDDMRDEKVELKFENIQPLKKGNKKKKKKLL